MKPLYPLAALSLLSLALAGCGGSSSTATPAPGPTTLSGTAAVGAPLANATVTIRDNDPTTADRTARTSATGSYSVDVSGLAAPYVLLVVGIVGDVTHTLHSAATAADVNGTINITPLTDLIVANTAQTTADECFTNFTTLIGGSAPSAKMTTALLNLAEADLEASLRKILTADGVAVDVDLLRTQFSANSTGLDLALDHLIVADHPTISWQAVITYIGPDNADAGLAKGQQFMDTFDSLNTNVASTVDTYVRVMINGVDVSAPPAAFIRGVAATSGFPVVGGTVTVRDSSAAPDITVTTATDGTYSMNVSTLTAPYMLEVTGGNLGVGGAAFTGKLYSAATANDAYGRVNITPLTDAIVAKVIGKDNATAFAVADGAGFNVLIDAAKLNTAETAMQAVLTTGMFSYLSMTDFAIPAAFDLMRTDFSATAGTNVGVAGLLGLAAVTVTVNADGTVTGTVAITPPSIVGQIISPITITF